MSTSRAGPDLRGRDRERASLDRLLDEVRAGQSRVLVLRGEGRRWQALHIAGLVLAAGIAGLQACSGNYTSGWIFRLLWGPWLYILLTASLFVLEAFVFRTPPGFAKESTPEKTAAA